MSEPRMTDERLAEIRADLEKQDRGARELGLAHGNYGEDFGALVLDLTDARAQLAAWESVVRAAVVWADEFAEWIVDENLEAAVEALPPKHRPEVKP